MPDARDSARPVGVFDSGVGGLTVLHELLVSLPHEDFLYLGDDARFPYGTRSPEDLRAIAVEDAEILLARGAKLLVIACNSATSAALDTVRGHLRSTRRQVDVVGVVAPESQAAVELTHNGRIGLLATPATVASGAYERAVRAADPLVELVSVPCPDLAPLIQHDAPLTDRVVRTVRAYCTPLREARVDTVVLGCTHYPVVRPMLQRILGRGVRLVTSGEAIARRVEHALGVRGIERPAGREGDYRFLCTADPAAFEAMGTRYLQLPMGAVERVELPARAAA